MSRRGTDRAAYAGLVPPEAVERQARASEERHPCCWEPLEGAHHPMCKHFEEPEAPAILPGQESLL